MPSCHGSYPTTIIIWYQYVTIKSATYGIYVNPHYCFIPESDNYKGFSAVNDKEKTKHYLPEKYSTMLYKWGNDIYTDISNNKIFPNYCDTQTFIIQNHYPYGYEDLYFLIRIHHQNNLTHLIDIISVPLTQLKLVFSLSKYF